MVIGPTPPGTGEIAEAITVTEVTGFAPNTSNQLATDNALTYSSTDNA